MLVSELSMLTSLLVLSIGSSIAILTRHEYTIVPISIISLAVLTVFMRGFSLAFSILVILLTLLAVLVMNTIKRSIIRGVDLTLITLVGIATLISVTPIDFASALILLIVASAATYLLAIVNSDVMNAINATIKYMVFMILGTILLILGSIILLLTSYGIFNSFLYMLGVCILIVGLSLEIGIAPFHMWVPDVFSLGDPIPIATIASIAKFVPVIVALRILLSTLPKTLPEIIVHIIIMFIAVISSISMFTGSIGGLTSIEPSRVLAYSSILNMGYILAPFAIIYKTLEPHVLTLALTGIVLQLFTNGFGKVFYFPILKSKGTSPILTWISSLSLMGMPPFIGFWSKLFIVLALVYADLTWLMIILIINSAISIFYYYRLAKILGTSWRRDVINISALIAAAIMLITLYPPNWFVDLIHSTLPQLKLTISL